MNPSSLNTSCSTLRLASRLAHIAPFHVMEIAKKAAVLERQGRHIIHMGIGEPDFSAAQPALDAAAQALINGSMSYTPASGMPALRQAISGHYRDHFQLDIPASRIVVTAGASGALLLACAALVEKNMQVLMSDPSYPCNRHFVAAFEGRAKLIPTSPEERFQLTDAMVRAHWEAEPGCKTGGVLLASPSNPTGTSIDPDELRKIIATVNDKGGFTIVDEIYQGLTYDAAPFSALSLVEGNDQGKGVIVINSFSKYFNMTGWRLGWLVVPENLTQHIEKLAQNLFICASALSQHAGLACFKPESLAIYQQRKAEFKRRRDYIVPVLRDLGCKVPVTPDGAFYVYADCTDLFYAEATNADELTTAILNEAGVVLVPGLDFGSHTAQQYIRVSYATSMENLVEAMARLRKFFLAHR